MPSALGWYGAVVAVGSTKRYAWIHTLQYGAVFRPETHADRFGYAQLTKFGGCHCPVVLGGGWFVAIDPYGGVGLDDADVKHGLQDSGFAHPRQHASANRVFRFRYDPGGVN